MECSIHSPNFGLRQGYIEMSAFVVPRLIVKLSNVDDDMRFMGVGCYVAFLR